jgi:predicted GIY-YIG superfamily endonuclease
MAYALSECGGRGAMFYVYKLQSETNSHERFTGFTKDLSQRLKKHNEGASTHTARHRPWRLVSYFAFENERAGEFEHHLKSGSGKRLQTSDSGEASSRLPNHPGLRLKRPLRSTEGSAACPE